MHRSHIKLWRSSRHLAVFLESNKQGGCINKKGWTKEVKKIKSNVYEIFYNTEVLEVVTKVTKDVIM